MGRDETPESTRKSSRVIREVREKPQSTVQCNSKHIFPSLNGIHFSNTVEEGHRILTYDGQMFSLPQFSFPI